MVKILSIILFVLLLALPGIRFLFPDMAMVVHVILLVWGIMFDLIDFSVRMVSVLRRTSPGSAGMFVGFFFMAAGVYGIVFPASGASKFDGTDWKRIMIFLGLLIVAFFLHLFIHLILPLLFTMAFNFYYGRKLLDFTPLPSRRSES